MQSKDIDKAFPYCISLLSANLTIQAEVTMDKIMNCIIENNLKSIPEEFYIFIGYYAKRNNLNLNHYLLDNIHIRKTLREYDQSVDGISYGLVNLFSLSESYIEFVDFRNYLDSDEYNKALDNLYKARGFFESYPEKFIQLIDVFNQILLAKIYSKDSILGVA